MNEGPMFPQMGNGQRPIVNRIQVKLFDDETDIAIKQQEYQLNNFRIAEARMRMGQMAVMQMQQQFMMNQVMHRMALAAPQQQQQKAPVQITGTTEPTPEVQKESRGSRAVDVEYEVVDDTPQQPRGSMPSMQWKDDAVTVDPKAPYFHVTLDWSLEWKKICHNGWAKILDESHIDAKQVQQYAIVTLEFLAKEKKYYTSVYSANARITKLMYKKFKELRVLSVPVESKHIPELVTTLLKALELNSNKKVYYTEEPHDFIYFVEELGSADFEVLNDNVLISKNAPMSEVRYESSIFPNKQGIWTNFHRQIFSVTRKEDTLVFTPVV